MPTIAFETPRDGVLLVRFPRGLVDGDFDAYFARMEETMARSTRRIGVVIDTRLADNPTAAQRRRQGEWMRQHRKAIADSTAGIAFVIDSAVLRFALSSVFLVQGMPVPYHVTGQLDEALAWAAQKAGDVVVTLRGTVRR